MYVKKEMSMLIESVPMEILKVFGTLLTLIYMIIQKMIKVLMSIAGCLLLGGCWSQGIETMQDEPVIEREMLEEIIPSVCQWAQCISIEIADTPDTRTQWLMFRTEIGQNNGMLFVFEKEDIYSFWMKNTLIPLDMVWIDANNIIVDIQTATPCTSDPCPTYTPSGSSLYVLEINAKRAEELWWKPGDEVMVSID